MATSSCKKCVSNWYCSTF